VPEYPHPLQFRAAGDRRGDSCVGAAICSQTQRIRAPVEGERGDEVTDAAHRLLGSLETAQPARDREVEAAKARARARERFG
jgi:hypothetical protein